MIWLQGEFNTLDAIPGILPNPNLTKTPFRSSQVNQEAAARREYERQVSLLRVRYSEEYASKQRALQAAEAERKRAVAAETASHVEEKLAARAARVARAKEEETALRAAKVRIMVVVSECSEYLSMLWSKSKGPGHRMVWMMQVVSERAERISVKSAKALIYVHKVCVAF